MPRLISFLALLILFSPTVHAQINEQAIVKIFVTSTPCNPDRPWVSDAPVESSGTGFIISGHRILTNAHVVQYHSYITVKRSGDAKRFETTAVFVSNQADLAVLEVADESIFSGIEPLEIGSRPVLRDQITVVGYPRGGDEVSYSSGIVSRVEVNPYAQSMMNLLTLQVDAAINPGNSGGPALKDGKVVGIAMMGIDDAQNIGYLIPPDVIEHFLTDIVDGKLDGLPHLEIRTAELENRMLRKANGLDEDGETGTLVYAASTTSNIHPGDVLLSMDDKPILSNRKIRLEGGLLVSYDHYITMRQVAEPIRFTLLRDGKEVTVTWKATCEKVLVPFRCYKSSYPYYLFGGYLFTPLYYDFIKTWGESWPDAKLFSFSDEKMVATPERNEIVYLHSILQHNTTAVAPGKWRVVLSVHGVPVRDFEHFTQLMDEAAGWVEIGFDDGLILRLDAKACSEAEPAIMDTYGIPKKKVL